MRDWMMKRASMEKCLEVAVFMLALCLYGWASDRSMELVALVGWNVCGFMFLRSVMLRDEEV